MRKIRVYSNESGEVVDSIVTTLTVNLFIKTFRHVSNRGYLLVYVIKRTHSISRGEEEGEG